MVLNEWRGSASDAEYSTVVMYFSYISLNHDSWPTASSVISNTTSPDANQRNHS